MNKCAEPVDQVELAFRHSDEIEHVEKSIRRDISSSALAGRSLFVSCDETSSVERLLWADGGFSDHSNFNLAEFFELPGGPDGEMDIEGLSIDAGYLWVTGSHSSKRNKPAPDETDRESALAALTDVDRDPNRYFLGRIPLEDDSDGVLTPVAKRKLASGTIHAGCLKIKKKGNTLMRAVRDDVHFGPFLDVPSKENGFDVEGLAVRGDRVFLGLRGPVLRGWAIILEMRMKYPGKRRIKPRRIDDTKRRYRKHFLNLAGLGIRDLLFDDEDLLILAGPTMDLDGPIAVHRWRNALVTAADSVVGRDAVPREILLPFGEGSDHAEGLELFTLGIDRRPQLLVVYDSPDKERLRGDANLAADLFDLE